jgi:GTP 3',8-cyclase
MFDRFNRKINYLRISVTDRCNLRCTYCMPEEGIRLLSHSDILSLEKMAEVVSVAVDMGITKVRITGGEPLVRKGVVDLVKMISEIRGVEDFGLTTNGISLEEFALPLAEAGLHRINISLDTMDPEKYGLITRGGDITKVLKGIEAAKKAGFKPVKINCVVRNSSQEPDALSVKEYAVQNGLEVRFIHEMDLENGCFTVVEGGEGGDCHKCNRLRLTANGFIKPCLFNDIEFSIHESGIRGAIGKAITFKPEKGSCNRVNRFHNIGG